jgi:hypothetical protein
VALSIDDPAAYKLRWVLRGCSRLQRDGRRSTARGIDSLDEVGAVAFAHDEQVEDEVGAESVDGEGALLICDRALSAVDIARRQNWSKPFFTPAE